MARSKTPKTKKEVSRLPADAGGVPPPTEVAGKSYSGKKAVSPGRSFWDKVASNPLVVILGILATILGILGWNLRDLPIFQGSTSSNSPAAVAKANSLLSSAKDWPLVIGDAFDDNRSGWIVRPTSNVSGDTVRDITNGIYAWQVTSKAGSTIQYAHPVMDQIQDFYLAVDAKTTSNPDLTGYGLMFRDQGTNKFYQFGIYPDQMFKVLYRDQSTDFWDRMRRLPNPKINRSGYNRMVVIGIGEEYWFYINDTYVSYLRDNRLTQGLVDLELEVESAGQESSAEFDNFELRRKP